MAATNCADFIVNNVCAQTNADVHISMTITEWLALFPNGNIRGQVRAVKGVGAALYEWSVSAPHPNPAAFISVVPSGVEKILVMRMPAADATVVGARIAFYDVRIEDAASGRKDIMFGGEFRLSDGVTT